jgi:hypothetical protein
MARVERVGDRLAVIRLNGQWESTHNRDGDPKLPIRTSATGDGFAVLKIRTGKVTALVWVLKGTFRNSPPDKPRATAAVIEWFAGP